jgi:hypothetical protein
MWVKTMVIRISGQPSLEQMKDNVECVNCLGSLITKDARCIREIKSKTAIVKAALIRKAFLPANWT